ncbi:MAG: HD domain-containing protein [Bacteroidota bacterium]
MIESIQKAWKWASRYHATQTYATPDPEHNEPYLAHIAAVTFEVMATLERETFEKPLLAIQCAILHDIVEDTPVTLEMLTEGFGEEVALGVSALTKNDTLPKPKQMPDSLARIKQQPKEVWVVKLSDRINNLDPPPHYWNEAKKKAYQEEAMQIYEALGSASPYLSTRILKKIKEYR